MSRRFVLTDGDGERICIGEMTALNLLLIEYHLVRDVLRALVPIGIVAIEMD